MFNRIAQSLADNLHVVWTIAFKDIVDATKTRLVLSLVLVLAVILLLPKALGLLVDLPFTEVVVFDAGDSLLTSELEQSDLFRVRRASSMSELETLVSEAIRVRIGLVVPPDFDQALTAGESPEILGYVMWEDRFRGREIADELELYLSELMEQTLHVNVESNLVTQSDNNRLLGMLSAMAITIIVTMGTSLVPHLMFEEKRTKTLEALLISPVSIDQIVMGKALAGMFYVLVAASTVFAVNWSGVTHWDVAILFSLSSALFAVALGLLLGNFFASAQEITGVMVAIMLILVAPVYAEIVNIRLPEGLVPLLPWIPTVALARIYRFAFSGTVPVNGIWPSLAVVLGAALLLYALVAWGARRLTS